MRFALMLLLIATLLGSCQAFTGTSISERSDQRAAYCADNPYSEPCQ